MLEPGIKHTPLYEFHLAHGAKMVAFAGHALPVQYQDGVLREHLHTRKSASLFDVSHMGQVVIRPDGISIDDLCLALESLAPVDVLGLDDNRQRYGFLTNEAGGILDDFIFAKRPGELFLVVNGARRDCDVSHLRTHLPAGCNIEVLFERRGLIALQGPASGNALARLCSDVRDMRFMDIRDLNLAGHACWVSRSGYTGEYGFEISTPINATVEIARILTESGSVRPAGLGARDSLRLEAGLCLHGSDIDEKTTPVEADLTWAIQRVRRPGGEREGGYPGAGFIGPQISGGADRLRVGLAPASRAPMRSGAKIFPDMESAEPIGIVTSGGFGPSVNAPVSMGYVQTRFSDLGTKVAVEVRNKRLSASIVILPFVKLNYQRR